MFWFFPPLFLWGWVEDDVWKQVGAPLSALWPACLPAFWGPWRRRMGTKCLQWETHLRREGRPLTPALGGPGVPVSAAAGVSPEEPPWKEWFPSYSELFNQWWGTCQFFKVRCICFFFLICQSIFLSVKYRNVPDTSYLVAFGACFLCEVMCTITDRVFNSKSWKWRLTYTWCKLRRTSKCLSSNITVSSDIQDSGRF